MPSTVKVRVLAARDLPVMDRNLQGDVYTDAYVEIDFAGKEVRTAVHYKTFAPVWNEDFRFEVADDSILQAEPIEFRVMDHDVYTSDDPVGVVHVDLSPLLARIAEGTEQDGGLTIQGWFPIFDTLRGLRGELCLMIKLQFIGDENPFRDSSAGVRFFTMSKLEPTVYTIIEVIGFVEDLVVDSDPEFEWMDRARSARTSNENRLSLLYQLGALVRKQLGKKVLELGGNAVLAFRQHFDVEGDSGIVARAYGTAAMVVTTKEVRSAFHRAMLDKQMYLQQQESVDAPSRSSPKQSPFSEKRPLPDFSSTLLNKLYSVGESTESNTDVQLITLDDFENRTRLHMGGVVMARSVKFLGKLASSKSDEETRDAWWIELREEVRSHAKSLCCSHVIGYTETCSIHDDVCILTGTGTAATLRTLPLPSILHRDFDSLYPETVPSLARKKSQRSGAKLRVARRVCSMCHVPYRHSLAPYANMRLVPCAMCGRKWVPEIILSTIEPWEDMPMRGQPVLVQSRVCRQQPLAKQASKNAERISESLPFLEYELQRQLILKLKVLGMNAAFRFESQVHVGADVLVGIATATAVYLEPLPPPPRLKVIQNLNLKNEHDKRLLEMQRMLEQMTDANRESMEQQRPRYRQRGQLRTRRQRKVVVAKRSLSPDFAIGVETDEDHEQQARRKSTDSNDSSGDSSSSSSSSSSSEDEELDEAVRRSQSEAEDGSYVSDLERRLDHEEDEARRKTPQQVYTDDRPPFVLEIDDETDEDIMAVLLERAAPPGVTIASTSLPTQGHGTAHGELMVAMQRIKWDEYSKKRGRLNRSFGQLFQDIFGRLCVRASRLAPCLINRVRCQIRITSDGTVELMTTATILMEQPSCSSFDRSTWDNILMRKETPYIVPTPLALLRYAQQLSAALESKPHPQQTLFRPRQSDQQQQQQDLPSEPLPLDPHGYSEGSGNTPLSRSPAHSAAQSEDMDDLHDFRPLSRHLSMPKPWFTQSQSQSFNDSGSPGFLFRSPSTPSLALHPSTRNYNEQLDTVVLSSLSEIPKHRVTRYLGVVSLHFIKEQLVIRSQNEVGAFYQKFLLEVNAMVRAHAAALGANALLSYTLTPEESQGGRNQVYHMLSVLGHAVVVTDEENFDEASPPSSPRESTASPRQAPNSGPSKLPPLALPPSLGVSALKTEDHPE